MKTLSLLAMSTSVLVSSLLIAPRLHAQVGPVASIGVRDSIHFYSVFVNSSSQPHCSVSISNIGDEPLTVSYSVTNTDFVWSNAPGATFVLQPGESLDDCYSFRPTTAGPAVGEITITTNDPNHPSATTKVTGIGLAFPLNVEAIADTAVTGSAFPGQFILTNTTPVRGQFNLYAGNYLDSWVQFAVSSFTLDPGQSATVDYTLDFSTPGWDPPGEYGADDIWEYIDIQFKETPDSEILDARIYVNVHLLFGSAVEVPSSLSFEVPIATVVPASFSIGNAAPTDLNYSIQTGSLVSEVGGARKYQTDFEQFPLGPIHGVGGWHASDYVYFFEDNHWTVSNENPFGGSKHLRCTSDVTASYNSANMFSASSDADDHDISIVDMMVDFEPGVTWEIIGQPWDFNSQPGHGLAILPDGTAAIVTEETWYDHPIPLGITLPDGYFNLRLSVSRSTGNFSVAIDGTVIYTGNSTNTMQYTNVEFVRLNEVTGKTLDVDNLRIYDGDEPLQLLSVDPAEGIVPPSGSASVPLNIDTRGFDAGTYLETLTIQTNDPVHPEVSVPVNITVLENAMPILSGVVDTVMVGGETLYMTYTATDSDDAETSVFSFMTVPDGGNWGEDIAAGNGFMTFAYHTVEEPFDKRIFGMIQARDPRGGIASKIFNIKVLAHKPNDFALAYFRADFEIATFTDTIVVDIAHPDIEQLSIKFKPEVPFNDLSARVKFILDGVEANTDSKSPHYLNHWLVPKLSGGYHSLVAIAEYMDNDFVYDVATRRAVIQVINSAEVTHFDVVAQNGNVIMELTDGAVIDISKPKFKNINIVARPSIDAVRSVKFVLNNQTARIDNKAPYALHGRQNGTNTRWPARPGDYELTAIPYMKYYGYGPRGIPLTVNFTVINGSLPGGRESAPLAVQEEIIDDATALDVYPVPVSDVLFIRLAPQVSGAVSLNIVNAQGQPVHVKDGSAETFRDYSISTTDVGMKRGIYFVILQQENGRRLTKKIIKRD